MFLKPDPGPTRWKLLAFLIGIPFLFACAKKGGDQAAEKVEAAEEQNLQKEKRGQAHASGDANDKKDRGTETDNEEKDRKKVERKLIREGLLKYEVDSVSREEQRVKKIVKGFDGYVADQKLQHGYDRKVMKMTLRVPAEGFESLVEEISEGVDGLDDKRIEVKDVTRKFIDLKARLKTKKKLEDRYEGLLERTDSVDEILRIEKEIQTLRENIESIEGKLRHLKDRIALSTLKLEFYRSIEQEEGDDLAFWSKVIAAAQAGWRGVQYLFIGLVTIWPLLILFAIGAFLGIRAYKRR